LGLSRRGNLKTALGRPFMKLTKLERPLRGLLNCWYCADKGSALVAVCLIAGLEQRVGIWSS